MESTFRGHATLTSGPHASRSLQAAPPRGKQVRPHVPVNTGNALTDALFVFLFFFPNAAFERGPDGPASALDPKKLPLLGEKKQTTPWTSFCLWSQEHSGPRPRGSPGWSALVLCWFLVPASPWSAERKHRRYPKGVSTQKSPRNVSAKHGEPPPTSPPAHVSGTWRDKGSDPLGAAPCTENQTLREPHWVPLA